jgi:hypothetical protein
LKVPDINFSAQNISELSCLEGAGTEAPLIIHLSDTDLRALAHNPLNLEGFPCHTTVCERGVQVTTSSGKVSTDSDLQDAASFNKEAARGRNQNASRKLWGL